MKRALIVLGLLCWGAELQAWPEGLLRSLLRDARRMVPRSLGQLILEREEQVLDETKRFPPELIQALAVDLSAGELRPQTLAALDAQAGSALEVIRTRQVSGGIIRLAAIMRIPADLSDPVLCVGRDGFPPGVVREYYAFVEENLSKIPVVLDDPAALQTSRRALPAYWSGLLARSRGQSDRIEADLFKGGRVVNHALLDYRSPVFAVASLSYSRAATAIAATWVALWREVRGDLTRQPSPRVVVPRDPGTAYGASPAPHPQQEARP